MKMKKSKPANLKVQAAKVKKLKQQLKVAEGKVKTIAKKGEQKIKAAQVQLKSRVQRAEVKVKQIKLSLERLEKSPAATTETKKKAAKTATVKKGKKMAKRGSKSAALKTKPEQTQNSVKL